MEDWGVRAAGWVPPEGWDRLSAVDAHTAGEPLRVVLGGFPDLKGPSVPALRADARARFDHLRRALMWEPRGHADMYGCIVVPPVTAHADFGVLFTHNEGFSTMCGHGFHHRQERAPDRPGRPAPQGLSPQRPGPSSTALMKSSCVASAYAR